MIEREFEHTRAELKELRHLWIETEERFVRLSADLAAEPARPAVGRTV